MTFFDRSPAGALRSFYGAGLLLPFQLLFIMIRWWGDLDLSSAGRLFVIEMLYYVVAWTIFPVLMISLTKWIGRADKFYDFLVAYNWAGVVAFVPRLPVFMINHYKLLPAPIVDMMILALFLVLVLYSWYVIKTSLDISGGQAAGLAATEFVLGLLLHDVTRAIVAGHVGRPSDI